MRVPVTLILHHRRNILDNNGELLSIQTDIQERNGSPDLSQTSNPGFPSSSLGASSQPAAPSSSIPSAPTDHELTGDIGIPSGVQISARRNSSQEHIPEVVPDLWENALQPGLQPQQPLDKSSSCTSPPASDDLSTTEVQVHLTQKLVPTGNAEPEIPTNLHSCSSTFAKAVIHEACVSAEDIKEHPATLVEPTLQKPLGAEPAASPPGTYAKGPQVIDTYAIDSALGNTDTKHEANVLLWLVGSF